MEIIKMERCMVNSKKELRASLKAKRSGMSYDEVMLKSAVICGKLSELLRDKDTVMAYCSSFNEVNVDSLMKALIADGRTVAVPVTEKETSVVVPSVIESLGDIKRGAYGIREPINIRQVHIDDLKAIIIPGIGFDRKGTRLGFGKGCYDRFLENYKGLKIGVCYEFQFLDELPADEYDVPMDIIVTESGCYAV